MVPMRRSRRRLGGAEGAEPVSTRPSLPLLGCTEVGRSRDVWAPRGWSRLLRPSGPLLSGWMEVRDLPAGASLPPEALRPSALALRPPPAESAASPAAGPVDAELLPKPAWIVWASNGSPSEKPSWLSVSFCSRACRSFFLIVSIAFAKLGLFAASSSVMSVLAPAGCFSAPLASAEAGAGRLPVASSTSTALITTSRPDRTKSMRSASAPCLQANALPRRCASLRQLAMAQMSCGVTSWFRSASSMRGHCLRNFTRCSMKCPWCWPANLS
mmetsp:Transcript_86663/g.280587  ORF Transcript_86663/g.280587 Transcript_86663/m.280587 type:complete len:271 (+) Transcript_86663:313-1125(+)